MAKTECLTFDDLIFTEQEKKIIRNFFITHSEDNSTPSYLELLLKNTGDEMMTLTLLETICGFIGPNDELGDIEEIILKTIKGIKEKFPEHRKFGRCTQEFLKNRKEVSSVISEISGKVKKTI